MIKFCKKCVTPNSRPRVVFNKDNVCNACINKENKKKTIDWKIRKKEFDKIVEKINDETKNDTYNCLVPWSGGKDSTFIALKLKHKFGLRPLLATFAPLIPNEVGIHNREIVLKHGFDTTYFRPNQKVARKLSKRFFFERGNPKVAWDAGINSMPVNTAIKSGIKNIFYAEHGESEYGGLVLSEESKKKRNEREVIEHIVGDYPQNWINEDITEYDIQPYIYPDDKKLNENQISSHYFAYYFNWSINKNYEFVKSVLPDFQENPFGRTEGTFTNFDSLDDKIDDLYYYMQYIKFGFGRATRDASRFIMNGEMSREKAIEFVRKYDGEFPKRNIKEVINYFDISEKKFEEIIDKHRNQEIWKSNIKNKWELINKL